jgi:hypothetical protein
VYHAFSAVARQLIPFSFVVVTLYMVATLVSYPMGEVYVVRTHTVPLFHLDVIAITWHKYVLLAFTTEMPSPYPSMSTFICVSTMHRYTRSLPNQPCTVLFIR